MIAFTEDVHASNASMFMLVIATPVLDALHLVHVLLFQGIEFNDLCTEQTIHVEHECCDFFCLVGLSCRSNQSQEVS
jgi:hypothetical protein